MVSREAEANLYLPGAQQIGSVEMGVVTGDGKRRENVTQLHVPQLPELAQAVRPPQKITLVSIDEISRMWGDSSVWVSQHLKRFSTVYKS